MSEWICPRCGGDKVYHHQSPSIFWCYEDGCEWNGKYCPTKNEVKNKKRTELIDKILC
jgi:hypothetical protein